MFLAGLPQTIVLPQVFVNSEENQRFYGAEAAVSWRPLEAGNLRVSYSWLQTGLDLTAEVAGPGHQLHACWYWDLPGNLEWDSSYRFNDSFNVIPAEHRVDTRLGWRPARGWEVSFVGQHLLDSQRVESPPLVAVPNEVGRSIYGKGNWRF